MMRPLVAVRQQTAKRQGTAEIMRKSLLGLAVVFSLQLAIARDFKKSYTLPPYGQIIIENNVGDIKVTGYKGTSIEITGKRKGPDRDVVDILDNSGGNRIEIRLKSLPPQESDARVDFEVRVPNSIEYNFDRLSSFSGNVSVSNVVGRLRAESVSGTVEIKDVKGLVSVTSFSGDVRAELGKDQGRSNMRFTSISGNIVVSAPSNLDALVDLSCASGALRTDFPLYIQESRYGPGSAARGRLGVGKQVLTIRSVTGKVSLLQK
jgi:hypothetical protein